MHAAGVHDKKQKTTVPHFGFMENVYKLSCTVHTAMYLGKVPRLKLQTKAPRRCPAERQ